MLKALLLGLCFVSISTVVQSSEGEKATEISFVTHGVHKESQVSREETHKDPSHAHLDGQKENIQSNAANMHHNKQIIEKEISEYKQLLEGVNHEATPVGIMLKTHYFKYIDDLQRLLDGGEKTLSIEEQLYQTYQNHNIFSRFY